VTDLMTEMQATGNPPTDIIKELAPDVEIGPDGEPKLGEFKPGQQDCCIM
jgi:peroxin-19